MVLVVKPFCDLDTINDLEPANEAGLNKADPGAGLSLLKDHLIFSILFFLKTIPHGLFSLTVQLLEQVDISDQFFHEIKIHKTCYLSTHACCSLTYCLPLSAME